MIARENRPEPPEGRRQRDVRNGHSHAMYACPRCHAVYLKPHPACGLDGSALTETDRDPMLGTSLGRYRVLERIGRGTMAIVYRGARPDLEHDVAIKVLMGEFASQPRLADRFYREALAASRIDHPGIVTVHHCDKTPEGLPFMVMDLVRGRTLELVLAEEGRLPAPRAGRIARQVAGSLDAAHRLGYVHRDVKPANLIITGSGTEEYIRILDFGLVKFSWHGVAKLTREGAVIGTPVYMSPEQAVGEEATHLSDLYSLGVVLFEMLAGMPPFSGTDSAVIIAAHLSQPPPPLPECGGLEHIAARLLEKRPGHRYASARELARALEDYLHAKGLRSPLSQTDPDLGASPPERKPELDTDVTDLHDLAETTDEHDTVVGARASSSEDHTIPGPRSSRESTDGRGKRPASSDDDG